MQRKNPSLSVWESVFRPTHSANVRNTPAAPLIWLLPAAGDQVVVKSKDNILYYGGKSIQQEKNTRVKARVKAHALRESIEAADKIVIMGHKLPDVDAVGSAIGINRIAQTLGKPTHIVVNEATSSLAPVLKLFEGNKDFPPDLFITGTQAKEFIGNGNGVLLIVVDVNRPSYTDAPELLKMVSSLVVIDHHRQTDESFENPTLSYIEPFASSACEMVAEILQYAGEEMRLKVVEADAMYAGIMVDTNNFMNKPVYAPLKQSLTCAAAVQTSCASVKCSGLISTNTKYGQKPFKTWKFLWAVLPSLPAMQPTANHQPS